MAAQHVQAYLERHRIGALFEDLMAKVISDTPDEPIPYLIRALKKLHTQPDGGTKGFGSLPPSRSRSPFAKSMGLTGTQISRQSFDEGGEHRSVLAKSWAGPDDHGKGSKFRPGSGSKVPGREYARPWLSGSKPPNGKSFGSSNKDNMRPPARSSHTRDNHEKPSWNAKTAVPTHDFDEWFSIQHRPRRTENEQQTHYQGATSWGRNGETEDMPVERTVHYQRRTTPALIYDGDDNLEEELYVGKEIKVRDEEDDSSSVQSYESNRSRKLKARHAAEEHRRQLQALLMSKGQSRGSSNGMSDNGDLHDDGMELLENVDELESEGVANIHSTGARVSKSMKQGATASESIRVSICARCAKVISGQPSERKYEVSSSVVSGSEVDDNFDSVSQVGSTTGPSRAPVWPSGFDSENDSSPRKSGGGHMWQNPSRSPPMKGRHMFRGGSFTGDAPDSSRPPTASSSRSDVGFPGRQQQSWNSGGYSSDNDTEANYDRVGSPEVASSRTWTRAPLESGSETDWDTRPGSRAPPGRGFARFDSGGESD